MDFIETVNDKLQLDHRHTEYMQPIVLVILVVQPHNIVNLYICNLYT